MITSFDSCVGMLSGESAGEVYLTASPAGGGGLAESAKGLYEEVRRALDEAGGQIFCERIFATQDAMSVVERQRDIVMGSIDDGVRPTRIIVEAGAAGEFAGVQIHAVVAGSPVEVVRRLDGESQVIGREMRIGDDRWLMVNGLEGGVGSPVGQQTREMFEGASSLLGQVGCDMRSVARTWLWLGDICDWYGEFNDVRNSFFKREGLIVEGNGKPRLPASTGIGLGSASGAACVLDFIALPGREESIVLVDSSSDQESAYAYGSAFSRAAIAPMPGGRTLFVSGTAAIDNLGRTEHVGQIKGQINATISHVRALLSDAGLGDGDVLSALVYCKTVEVEQEFCDGWGDLSWPLITMIGDICRDDLLFEVELVAGPAGEKVAKG